jgi:hypothetical protein
VHPDALEEVIVGLCTGARAGLNLTPHGGWKTPCHTWSTTDWRGGEVTHATIDAVATEEPEPRSVVYTDVMPTLLRGQARRRRVQERHRRPAARRTATTSQPALHQPATATTSPCHAYTSNEPSVSSTHLAALLPA